MALGLTQKHETQLERSTRDKHSGLFGPFLAAILITLAPVANVIKLLIAVNYKNGQKASVYVPGKPFEHSLIFANNAKTYLSGAPLGSATCLTPKWRLG